MKWNLGYTATYYLATVDPLTWRDRERIEITGGKISRNNTGLRVSADIDCKNYRYEQERWVRVWMIATQGDDAERVPLFTGITAPPDRDIEGAVETNQLACNSVLQPAQDVRLPLGWYARTSVPAGVVLKELLSVCPAPFTVEGETPYLADYIIAEQNENRLTMTEKVLAAIGWRLRIGGDGSISACPPAVSPAAVFDALTNDVIEPQIKATNTMFSCPNVFRAVQGDNCFIARDDDPDSPLSTVSRGREIWAEESSADLNDGEDGDAYAARRLQELQKYGTTISYNRRYDPNVVPTDRIELRYPGSRISGVYEVTSQGITLGAGCKTSEEVIG